jgi:hypothetical protein
MNMLFYIIGGILLVIWLVMVYFVHILMYFDYRKESGIESVGGYLSFIKFIKFFKQYEWMRSEKYWNSLFTKEYETQIHADLYQFKDKYYWLDPLSYLLSLLFGYYQIYNKNRINEQTYEQYQESKLRDILNNIY